VSRRPQPRVPFQSPNTATPADAIEATSAVARATPDQEIDARPPRFQTSVTRIISSSCMPPKRLRSMAHAYRMPHAVGLHRELVESDDYTDAAQPQALQNLSFARIAAPQ